MLGVVEASGKISADDLTTVIRGNLWRLLWIPFAFFVIFTGVVSLGVMRRFIENPEGGWILLASWWWLPTFLLLWTACILAAPRFNAKRQLASSRELSSKQSYRFSDERIECWSDLGSGVMDWQSFHAAKESKGAFVLWRSNAVMQFIPKSHLRSEADVIALRDLIQSKLGKKAKMLRGI